MAEAPILSPALAVEEVTELSVVLIMEKVADLSPALSAEEASFSCQRRKRRHLFGRW